MCLHVFVESAKTGENGSTGGRNESFFLAVKVLAFVQGFSPPGPEPNVLFCGGKNRCGEDVEVLLYGGGASMVLLCLILLVSKKRMSGEKEKKNNETKRKSFGF